MADSATRLGADGLPRTIRLLGPEAHAPLPICGSADSTYRRFLGVAR